ncbi:glucuronate isomerase [Lachnospiraceae bacterium KH1T2]|nr:glucuronate isomerase [Lachnospiraceae bacterium KH1T2]
MKSFLSEDFMLQSETAAELYRNFADVKKVPIVDYHCHIPVAEIREDKHFKNITELWLGADHYKWRQMRVNGISEKYITGDGDDYDKFCAFAEIMPRLLGNPLYHWSHLELKRYFDIDEPLSLDTADDIWKKCNAKIAEPQFSARGLIEKSNVSVICTTDDPCDTLSDHKALSEDGSFKCRVLPAFRPDSALEIWKDTWTDYIKRLEKCSGIAVKGIDDLLKALECRIDHFAKHGCRVSDHGIYDVRYKFCDRNKADEIVNKRLNGEKPTSDEIYLFLSYMLIKLAKSYKAHDFVMQLHYGVVRDNNKKALKALGINTGFDAMHNDTSAAGLLEMLNAMESEDALPKTIIYSLNPADNAVIDCAIGCFAEEGIRGKVQHGSAWWFNDHFDGMEAQLRSYAALSTLGNHIGMLTDSRSFLSYTRHEYFRRILCNFIGEYVETGMYPYDENALGKLIKDICLDNTLRYFEF